MSPNRGRCSLFACLLFLSAGAVAGDASDDSVFERAERKAATLVAQLTLEEKVEQLQALGRRTGRHFALANSSSRGRP